MKYRALKVLAGFFLTLVLTCAVAMLGIGIKIAEFGLQGPKMKKADYILVLGAKTRGSEPTEVFRQRILYGIELYQAGLGGKIIFTGGPGKPPQAEVARQLARKRGVPDPDILTESLSQTTFENLLFTREKVQDPSATYLIVTDPYHLKRAILMTQDLNMKASPAPLPNSAFQSVKRRLRLLVRESVAYYYYLFFKRP